MTRNRTDFFLDPIQRAIDRQLSQRDRRLLPDYYGITATWDSCTLAWLDSERIVISDNGLAAAIIEQAIDLTLMRNRARIMQEQVDDDPQ